MSFISVTFYAWANWRKTMKLCSVETLTKEERVQIAIQIYCADIFLFFISWFPISMNMKMITHYIIKSR